MTILGALTDLIASAPNAQAREYCDRASACVESKDWPEAIRWIDRIPPGYTSWHERLQEARDKIDWSEADDDSGLLADVDPLAF